MNCKLLISCGLILFLMGIGAAGAQDAQEPATEAPAPLDRE